MIPALERESPPGPSPASAEPIALVIGSMGAGGAERVLSLMANYWAERGHPVSLITLDPAPSFYPLSPGVRHVRTGLGGTTQAWWQSMGNNLRVVSGLRRAVLATGAATVISFITQSNVHCLLATIGTGVRVIACERSDPNMEPTARPWALLRRLLYGRAAGVVCQTERAMAYFGPSIRARGRVIPNPVAVDAIGAAPGLAGASSRSGRVVIGMGRLGAEKRFDLLIAAFALAGGRHPDWRLEIWGEGPLRPQLESQVRAAGLQDRVRLPGRTTEAAAVMRASDLFVLSSAYEGFPNALCEAMACGLPVISVDCPSGPAEIIRHGHDGLLVPTGDAAALAAAMDRLMGNPAERLALAEEAPHIADRLCLPATMARWDSLLAEAAGPRGRSTT